MNVKVISDTVQEFNGERFYLCGFYFQRKGKKLHRAVWEYHFGAVPDGCDIHHVDGNRAHNDVENLACLPRDEHHRKHANTPEFLEYARKHIEEIRVFAVEWHKSEAGKAWHSEQGKQNWKKRKPRKYICTECGREYETKHVYGKDSNHFCGQNCRAKHGRRMRAARNEN